MERDLLFLNRIFSFFYYNTIVDEKGNVYEQRQQVIKEGNLKLEIYPNEHAPPHFHVTGPDIDACFTILEGEYMYGEIDSKSIKKIKYIYNQHRLKIIQVWNDLRPTNCPVGKVEL